MYIFWLFATKFRWILSKCLGHISPRNKKTDVHCPQFCAPESHIDFIILKFDPDTFLRFFEILENFNIYITFIPVQMANLNVPPHRFIDGIISENQAPMDDSHKQDALHENQRKSKKTNAKTRAYAFKKICDYIISSFSALSDSEKFAPSCVTPIQSSRPERELLHHWWKRDIRSQCCSSSELFKPTKKGHHGNYYLENGLEHLYRICSMCVTWHHGYRMNHA